MNKHAFIHLLILVMLLGIANPAQAQLGERQALLVLSIPLQAMANPNGIDLPELVEEAAQPLLDQLAQMQDSGLVLGFRLLPRMNAVLVAYSPRLNEDVFRNLPGVADVRQPGEAQQPACTDQVFQQILDLSGAGHKLAGIDPQATDPSIEVYLGPGYSYVTGTTTANVSVTMVVRNSAGLEKIRLETTSGPTGFYFFFTGDTLCAGADWTLEPGDVVEVSAGGSPVTMTVVPLSVQVDTDNETISGVTRSSRQVDLYLTQSSISSPCPPAGNTPLTTTSGSIGAFSYTIAGGLDNSARGTISVQDANGNRVSTFLVVPYLWADYEGDFGGVVNPNSSYYAALKRNNLAIDHAGGVSSASGSFNGYFSTTPQAGDVIEVDSHGKKFSVHVVGISNLVFDTVNNRVTGQAGAANAGRVVRFAPARRNQVSCQYSAGCGGAVVAGDGSFILDFGANFDLQPGDYDYGPVVYNDQGNGYEFQGSLYVPHIDINPGDKVVGGYWHTPNIDLDITLKDSMGTVKDTLKDRTSSYSANYYGYFSSGILPNDRVEVTDGITTLTVASVPDLNALLDAGNEVVTGTAPDGEVRVLYQDRSYMVNPGGYNSGSYSYSYSSGCVIGNSVSGQYSVPTHNFFNADAPDRVEVYINAGGGNVAHAQSHAFEIIAEKGNMKIEGYLPKPGRAMTAELWRGESMLESRSTLSSNSGSYWVNFSSSFQDGDVVIVNAPGLVTYDMQLPTLTLQQDLAQNRVFGSAPPDGKLTINVMQPAPYDYWTRRVQADSSGNYSVTFNDAYHDDCSPLVLGDCNRPQVIYSNPEGHTYFATNPLPSETADLFEGDNDFSSASLYNGIQHHTFHTSSDVDWIKIVVPPGNVGKQYIFETLMPGPNARTNMYLYDSSGTNLLISETQYSPVTSTLLWMATSSGTFYIKILPYSGSNTTNCGSFYSFFVSHTKIYLPIVGR